MTGRRVYIALAVAALLALSWNPAPAGENMVTDFSQSKIQVDVRFHGERIYFFGTLPDPEAQVVVKLVPKQSDTIKLMRKGRVVLFWMGVKQFEIGNLPYLFKIHSSGPLKNILTPELAQEHRLSYHVLQKDMKLKLLKGDAAPDDHKVMFDGFVGIKEGQNLYKVDENRIRISKGSLFEHYFTFPDKAKEGEYLVESYAIKNGKVLGVSRDVVKVEKVGLTAWLYRTAQHNGILYGIMAVVIALGAGLLVGVFFKGGGH